MRETCEAGAYAMDRRRVGWLASGPRHGDEDAQTWTAAVRMGEAVLAVRREQARKALQPVDSLGCSA